MLYRPGLFGVHLAAYLNNVHEYEDTESVYVLTVSQMLELYDVKNAISALKCPAKLLERVVCKG